MAEQTLFDSADQVKEEWKPIEEFPHYFVSNLGRIKSLFPRKHTQPREHIIRPRKLLPGRYMSIGLRRNRRCIPRDIHRIVITTFRGPRPPQMQCRHLDGDRTNNCLSNLVWGTIHENIEDKKRHGRLGPGEKSHYHKLNDDLVRQIREMSDRGMSSHAIDRTFGLNGAAWYVIKRKTWAHVV